MDMSCLRLFKTAFGLTMRRLCRQIPLLAGLVLLSGALSVLAGRTAAGALSDGVAFSGITLAVTAPAGDDTPALLERILAVLRAQVRESGACLWVYLVHDPVNLRSVRYDVTPDGQAAVTRYDTLVSRGKTVMPQVERKLMRADGTPQQGSGSIS